MSVINVNKVRTCLLLLFAVPIIGFGQAVEDQYFLRHSMIFFEGEVPQVSPAEILFTKQSICGFSSAPYSSPLLRRGDPIQIVSINRANNPGVVAFKNGKSEFKIELANGSKRLFKESFDLAFSRNKYDFGWGGATRWSAVIRKFGFPVARCHNDGGWFYFLEFSPNACGSLDGCVLKITSQGLDVYGYT